ncbi:hypothetical protein NCAS_0E02900 [Naumovozyma castellii]|uniref:Small ribosomal subunit protein bS18m n=1 Tax=Naumovozyma castellii TaxID=27288 RepID=G0VFU3_NAUCA|nr:hypothetical protein NCAS_0E02900 [Naumovozyma castellii CBS 4309]CCC70360.1 hypothetical protein NCAS_0E02900 [Naumovozyma castellii CBS 4309]
MMINTFTRVRKIPFSPRQLRSSFHTSGQCCAAKGLLQPTIKKNINLRESQAKSKTNSSVKAIDEVFVKKFQQGSIYDPFDFSMAKVNLDRKTKSLIGTSKTYNISYNINPLDLYSSPSELNKFISSTGKILHRDVTGLSAKNQRRLSKAIKRAQSIGLLSKTHKHVDALPRRSL